MGVDAAADHDSTIHAAISKDEVAKKPVLTPQTQHAVRMWRPSVEQVAATATLAGAVIYVTLFAVYQSYYEQLGLRPEDAGVNQLFVLTRSLAFLIVVVGAGLYVVAPLAFGPAQRAAAGSPADESPKLRPLLVFAFAVLALSLIWRVALSGWSEADTAFVFIWRYFLVGFAIGITCNVALAFIAPRAYRRLAPASYRRRPRTTRRLIGFAITLAASLVGLVVGLDAYAEKAGNRAAQALPVDPLTFLGLPLLDVEAKIVEVQWIGSEEQAPRELSDAEETCALLLGQNTTVALLLMRGDGTAGPLLQLPVSQIALATRSTHC